MECKEEDHNSRGTDEYIVVEKQLAGCVCVCIHFRTYPPHTRRGRERVCVEALRLYAERIVQVSKENSTAALHCGTFLTLTDISPKQAQAAVTQVQGIEYEYKSAERADDLLLGGC